jgi:hypothetical protein
MGIPSSRRLTNLVPRPPSLFAPPTAQRTAWRSVIVGLRHETCDPERSRPGSVLIEPTGHTLEVVPPFDGLHATEHRVQVLQRTIAVGTPQRGRGNLRVPRHGCRSPQVWSATLPGCGGILAHAGDGSNRLAALPSRNPVHFAAAVSLYLSVEVSVEVTATTKLSPPVAFS